MLVFWKQRLVILATPKTGSTAIEAALESLSVMTLARPPELKHTPAYRYQRFISPYLRAASGGHDFTAVALMREPIDWLGSWYRFRRREEIDDPGKSTRHMDFADFARGYMQAPRPEFAQVGRQAKFLSGMKEAPLGVDRLFRFEEIGRFTAFLEERLDMPLSLPRLNISPPGDLSLPPTLEQDLRAYLAPEYALYDAID